MQQNQSLLGAQPGVVGTPSTVYGQSMVSNAGMAAAAGATTAYPTQQQQQQSMQQRQNIALQQVISLFSLITKNNNCAHY